jgi:hypothetical protein
VGLLKNTLRPKHKVRNHKRAAHHSTAFIGKGRTVENTLKTKHKERNHKRAAHHSIPDFIGRNWVGLLKILLDKTQRKESQRAHHSIPAFIGNGWDC